MANYIPVILTAAFVCASCATPAVNKDTADNLSVAAADTENEIVPDTVIVHEVPVVHPTERTNKGRCTYRPPIGSRISRMKCVSAEQRKRNNEEGKRLLEAADLP